MKEAQPSRVDHVNLIVLMDLIINLIGMTCLPLIHV